MSTPSYKHKQPGDEDEDNEASLVTEALNDEGDVYFDASDVIYDNNVAADPLTLDAVVGEIPIGNLNAATSDLGSHYSSAIHQRIRDELNVNLQYAKFKK